MTIRIFPWPNRIQGLSRLLPNIFFIGLCLVLLAACSGLAPQAGGGPPGAGPGGPIAPAAPTQDTSGDDTSRDASSTRSPALLPPLPAGEVGTRFDPQDNGVYLTKTLTWLCPDSDGNQDVDITGAVIRILTRNQAPEDCNNRVLRIVNYDKHQYVETMTGHDNASGVDCAYRVAVGEDFIAEEPTMVFFLGKVGFASTNLETLVSCPDANCAERTQFDGAFSIAKGVNYVLCPSLMWNHTLTPNLNHRFNILSN